MSNRIRRHHSQLAGIALTNSVATTAEIDLTAVASGCVLVPAGSTLTTLTYYGARQPGSTYVAIQDSSGNPVTQTVAAGKGYPLPAACADYGALKLVANTAGAVDVSLKG
ncbi:MAG TPA: hypothetical protein VG056_12315 [Pirellulales bacterium]|jgi:hypothetical protein|nr:hypothetical protein [Pirellulales bacterium]